MVKGCKEEHAMQKHRHIIRMISDLTFWNYNKEFRENVYLWKSEDLQRECRDRSLERYCGPVFVVTSKQK